MCSLSNLAINICSQLESILQCQNWNEALWNICNYFNGYRKPLYELLALIQVDIITTLIHVNIIITKNIRKILSLVYFLFVCESVLIELNLQLVLGCRVPSGFQNKYLNRKISVFLLFLCYRDVAGKHFVSNILDKTWTYSIF
jgi:hypothetical protein